MADEKDSSAINASFFALGPAGGKSRHKLARETLNKREEGGETKYCAQVCQLIGPKRTFEKRTSDTQNTYRLNNDKIGKHILCSCLPSDRGSQIGAKRTLRWTPRH